MNSHDTVEELTAQSLAAPEPALTDIQTILEEPPTSSLFAVAVFLMILRWLPRLGTNPASDGSYEWEFDRYHSSCSKG